MLHNETIYLEYVNVLSSPQRHPLENSKIFCLYPGEKLVASLIYCYSFMSLVIILGFILPFNAGDCYFSFKAKSKIVLQSF